MSLAMEMSAALVVERTPADRQSLPVGLEGEDGVWPEPAVRSVQAVLTTSVSTPDPAFVTSDRYSRSPTWSVPESVVWQVTTAPETEQDQLPETLT